MVYLPTILYNMELWANMKDKELDELEKKQTLTLRRILGIPATTSYYGILWETGIWRVREHLIYKRLMLYHNIMSSADNRVAKKLIIEEEKYGMKDSWAMRVRREAKELGIKLEEGVKQLKSAFKKEVKCKLENKVKEEINNADGTKLRTVKKKEYGEKNYLKGNFDADEVAEIMKIRLHMINLRMNYKNSDISITCRLCYEHQETTEHIFLECKTLNIIREHLKDIEIDNDQEPMIRNILTYKRIASIIMTEIGNNQELRKT